MKGIINVVAGSEAAGDVLDRLADSHDWRQLEVPVHAEEVGESGVREPTRSADGAETRMPMHNQSECLAGQDVQAQRPPKAQLHDGQSGGIPEDREF